MSFSFGTSSVPANTSLTGGFNFGANKPATPGFGLTATSQPSTGLFGSTSTPAFGAAPGFSLGSTPAFGTSAAPTFGATSAAPAFGASTTPAFGTSSTAPTFGSTATPAFGSSSTASAFGSTTTPAFGTAAATPAFGASSTTPAFGATTTPAFGASATPAFGATTTPAFGATTTPAFGASATPAFGATTPAFGASTSTPAFGLTTTPTFGTTTTSAFGASATPAFGTTGLGTGTLNFGGASSTTTSTGLSFGTPSTTKTGLGGLGSFGFGTTSTAQTSFSLSNTSATTTSSAFGLNLGTTNVSGAQTSTSAAPSLGLGGVAPTGSGTATSSTGDGKSEPLKQTKLPNEISSVVGTFKDFVKKQKALSSEVTRLSIKPIHKVGREAECTLRAALALRGETNKARAQSKRLRTAAGDALVAAEAAARDSPGSKLDRSSPPKYIKELMAELEQQLITFRRQIDVAEKQMQASPKLLTERELTLGIQRMYESLVVLAGRLQAVHTQVEAQKEQYLNLRKYILKDPTNVFDTPSQSAILEQILQDAEGMKKKIKSENFTDLSLGLGSAVLTDLRAALGNIQQLAGPPPFTYLGSNLTSFPAVDGTGTNWQPQPQTNFNTSSLNLCGFGALSQTESSGFQLQKPPGKRGKQ